MDNVGIVLSLLCVGLLPMPIICQPSPSSQSGKIKVISVSRSNGKLTGVWIGCVIEDERLAPSYTHSINPVLRKLYKGCIHKKRCLVSLKEDLGLPDELDFDLHIPYQRHPWAERILTCLPQGGFHSPSHQIITKSNGDVGFLIGHFDESQQNEVRFDIVTQEGESIALALCYMDLEDTSSSTANDKPIIVSGGLCIHCAYIDNDTPKVLVNPENGRVVVTLSNVKSFAIVYYRLSGGNLSHFQENGYVQLLNSCNTDTTLCPDWPEDAATSPRSTTGINKDTITQAMTSEVSMSGAVIGVSVTAGLLLAAILVIVFIFLLWKRNMLALPLTSTADREAAPTPPKQKRDNPSDGAYSEPYDNVRTPDILYNRNGSNSNLYAEVRKDRKKPPLVSGSSLHIEENDLYSGSGHGAPKRGPRDSAGVYIVENEGYDSLGTT